ENGHDENTPVNNPAHHAGDTRLHFPERLQDLTEKVSPPQFVRVLVNRGAGIGILRGAVAYQDKGGVAEVMFNHLLIVARAGNGCKAKQARAPPVKNVAADVRRRFPLVRLVTSAATQMVQASFSRRSNFTR